MKGLQSAFVLCVKCCKEFCNLQRPLQLAMTDPICSDENLNRAPNVRLCCNLQRAMLRGAMAIKILEIVAKSRTEFYFRQPLREQNSCIAQHRNDMLNGAIGMKLVSQWRCDTCCKRNCTV